MEHAAAGGRLRLGARADGRRLDRLSAHPVRILHGQSDFIRGVRREVEHAAGEAVGHGVGRAEDPFAAHAEERQRLRPRRVAGFPVGDVDRRVPIRIARDRPLEAEVDERRGFHDELAGRHGVVGLCRASANCQSGHEQPTERSRGPQHSHDILRIDGWGECIAGAQALRGTIRAAQSRQICHDTSSSYNISTAFRSASSAAA